jgi:hypothetical protein
MMHGQTQIKLKELLCMFNSETEGKLCVVQHWQI